MRVTAQRDRKSFETRYQSLGGIGILEKSEEGFVHDHAIGILRSQRDMFSCTFSFYRREFAECDVEGEA